jgi:translocation and assembly module TamA
MLRLLLESEGYYGSEIDIEIDIEKHQADFNIDAGKIYRFTTPIIIVNSLPYIADKDSGVNLPNIKSLKATENVAAKVSLVVIDEEFINNWIEKNNCFFHYHVNNKAIVNHINHTVSVSYDITHDKNVVFGDISFLNLSSIDQSYLMNLLTIKKGECFKRSSINKTRSSLKKSNLLDKILVILPEIPSADGVVPIVFSLSENAHHTIKAGSNFSTDLGFGFNIGWEHRNFFSEGEKLSSNLSITEIEKELSAIFSKPFFRRKDQTLKIEGSIKREDNDAYESNGVSLSESIERKFKNNWLAGIGTKYNYESITEDKVEDNHFLVSMPLFASQNKKDNPLDPKNGWTLYLNTAPFIDVLDTNIIFLKNHVSGTYYLPLTDSQRVTLAFKTAVGSIAGSPSEDIPATERFYAGGATSVRGYGYQLVGPLNDDNDPIGGSSVMELSTEIRMKISEEYGIVPFVDCGTSFSSRYMDSGEKLLCGAGIGLRYYTSFGPLRIDYAVPLDKRPGIDDSFQLYFSIGGALKIQLRQIHAFSIFYWR